MQHSELEEVTFYSSDDCLQVNPIFLDDGSLLRTNKISAVQRKTKQSVSFIHQYYFYSFHKSN